ncbi:copper radical oxidase [Atractiella rhizophila]|nr:copper radical oxidase [Atractiella rhizophila]
MALLLPLLLQLPLSSAQKALDAKPNVNGFLIAPGGSVVSAQQLFLGNEEVVYILDKVEGNPTQVNGHPAWAASYDLNAMVGTPMDITTNTFCAGGNVLGDGTWINVGGNKAVGYGGLDADEFIDPYHDGNGGLAIRLLHPCTDGSCTWIDDTANYMKVQRWYPTVETLEDGRAIIIGGDHNGGYVNDAQQNEPTIEYFPKFNPDDAPIDLNILAISLPANLFSLTWLMPSGNLFIQTNWLTEMYDYKNKVEHTYPNVPHSVRTYPGSAMTAMLPLTPANGWTGTILFCGGTNLQPDQWTVNWNIAAYPTDDTCVKISPDVSEQWEDDDSLPEGRIMGNGILLPDGRLFMLNGIAKGTAGYGNTSWAIGQAYGTDPIYSPAMYNYKAPAGSKWSREGLQDSTVPRLYHSSATLLADGSVFSSGSNPNADYIAPNTPGYPWVTEYRVEKFYPDYYNKRRPVPQGIPASIGYGGAYFEITLTNDDIGDEKNLENTKFVLIRTGFSTHAMNMGQRYVQLNNTYTKTDSGATLSVSPLPPNPAILVPGPCLAFVVVNGVPSQGKMIMIGNGQIGKQPTAEVAPLPGIWPRSSRTETVGTLNDLSGSNSGGGNGTSGGGGSSGNDSAGTRSSTKSLLAVLACVAVWAFV